MTGRREASGMRQVVGLLAALGVGAGLVGALVLFAPDVAQLPVAQGEGAQLIEAWRLDDDDAPDVRQGSGSASEPDDETPSGGDPATTATPSDDAATPDEGATQGATAGGAQDSGATGGEAADEGSAEDAVAETPDGEADGGAGEAADQAAADQAEADQQAADDEEAAAAAAADQDEDQARSASAEALVLVNAERAEAGCDALTADPALDDLAAAHSADMRDRGYFDHVDPDGRTPWDRAEAAGLSGVAAENIARGQPDAAAVVAAWMDSPGHRANILDCSLSRHGLGAADGSGGPWWTQVFAR